MWPFSRNLLPVIGLLAATTVHAQTLPPAPPLDLLDASWGIATTYDQREKGELIETDTIACRRDNNAGVVVMKAGSFGYIIDPDNRRLHWQVTDQVTNGKEEKPPVHTFRYRPSGKGIRIIARSKDFADVVKLVNDTTRHCGKWLNMDEEHQQLAEVTSVNDAPQQLPPGISPSPPPAKVAAVKLNMTPALLRNAKIAKANHKKQVSPRPNTETRTLTPAARPPVPPALAVSQAAPILPR